MQIQNKKKRVLLVFSSLLLLICLAIFVNAETLTAIDPTNSATIAGNHYFNSSFQLNTTNSNASRMDFFLKSGTTFTLLGSNNTVNVSLNTSGYGVIKILNNTAGITDGTYDIVINTTVTTPSANNDTLTITNVVIDNTNPTATITSQYKSVNLYEQFIADCGTSTDAIDTSLDWNITIWQPSGAFLSSINGTGATGSSGSATANFIGDKLSSIPGIHSVNCRVTDNAGNSVTSSNITFLMDGDTGTLNVAQVKAKENQVQTKKNIGLIAIVVVISIFVVVMLIGLLIHKQRKKKRR